MTGRGATLAALPVVVIGTAEAVPGLFWPGMALFCICLTLVIVDGRRAPGPADLSVAREHDPILSVGRPNPVTVRLGCSRPVTAALVRDESPAEMQPAQGAERMALPGVLRYSLTPRSRGERRFGRTVVRAPGPWGLGYRQSELGQGETVRADADIAALRSYDALARRGRLWELGVRAQRRSGEGTEFERLREAVPDDPLRAINWRATARTGRLMAAELIPERAQPVIICLDHGRLMGVGAGSLTKLDHAVNAALLLIHVVLRSGDRAGLLGFSDRVTAAVSPRAGRAQIGRFIDAVRPLRAGDTESDYDEALTHLSRWQRRRALIAIFTDVLDPDQGAALVRQCGRLSRRHLPLVITVRDPAIDAAAHRPPADAGAMYARAVAGGLLADREDTLRLLRRSGVETLDSDARTLSPRLVNRYVELKRRARL